MGLGLLLSALFLGYPVIFMPSYISEGTPFPKPLSKTEEAICIHKLQDEKDGPKAKEKLISHNLRLVAHVAKKYSNTGMDQDDLISIGTVGLIKAIDTYSSDRSTRLGTYAARCIENAIYANRQSLATLPASLKTVIHQPCFSDKI